MPFVKPNNPPPNASQRSTFKPPWVKQSPQPIPMPTPDATVTKTDKPALTKQSRINIPVTNEFNLKPTPLKNEKVIPIAVSDENDEPKQTFARLRKTPAPQAKNQPQEKEFPEKPFGILKKTPAPKVQKQPEDNEPPKNPFVKLKKTPAPPQLLNQTTEKEVPNWKKPPTNNTPKPPTNNTPKPPTNNASKPPTMDKLPPRPPPPPGAPTPPPPPPMMNNDKPPIEKKPLTKERKEKLDSLRSRPRRRPDWSDMMKEVEEGKKLRHVQCNDRSAPVIPKEKAKGQFVYDSENKKPDDDHNQLLQDIQKGIKLKKVKINDRSKPNLDGLRKFRRQMTIEEQIQKSVSMADIVAAAQQPDELDDIDKVRDDLQSAKQMLALELRNKEAIERENKRLLARVANLEAELEKEKCSKPAEVAKGRPTRTADDEKLITRLKEEAAEANTTIKDIEKKYHTTAEELDNTKRKLENAWLRNQQLEMQLKSVAAKGTPVPRQLTKQLSTKMLANIANGNATNISDDDDETESDSEEESDEEEISAEEKQKREQIKELKMLSNKLRTFKEKQNTSLDERKMLKSQLTNRQSAIKEERRKYKLLQKEVDKMEKLMREVDEEDDEEEEESEEESETESESEEECEEVSDGELPESQPFDARKKNLLDRTKRHENRLSSLKKGNYLMKANIERLQDDLNKQRDMSAALQAELNSLLADLEE